MKKVSLIIVALLSLSATSVNADVINAQTLMDKYTAPAQLVIKTLKLQRLKARCFSTAPLKTMAMKLYVLLAARKTMQTMVNTS